MSGAVLTVVTSVVSLAATTLCGFLIGSVREKAAAARERRGLEDQNTLMLCRMCIYDEHFSLDEKVDAYRLYRSRGGNSRAKHYMDELLGEDADVYLEHHPR